MSVKGMPCKCECGRKLGPITLRESIECIETQGDECFCEWVVSCACGRSVCVSTQRYNPHDLAKEWARMLTKEIWEGGQ